MNRVQTNTIGIEQVQQQIRDYLHQYWQLFLAEGIIFMGLGLAAIAIPQLFSVALVIFLGWLFVFGGLVHIARSIYFSGMPGFGLWLFIGAMQLLLGYWFISQPVAGLQSLTILMTLFFGFEGVAKMTFASMMRPLANWGYIMFSGFTALVLAVVIWLGWPETSEWMLGILLGINMILLGWSLIKISLYHKHHA